ncbi:hypothetical protein TNCV_775021 [Trichonephila clavipes]|nr:hypothetical protein TNCV_775021 [Trichonephila clavipes]
MTVSQTAKTKKGKRVRELRENFSRNKNSKSKNEALVQLAKFGLVCSHPRIPRAHQAGFSRRFLAGVGYFESVRRHGPGLALLTNGSVQQQHEGGRGCCGNRGGCNCRRA